MAANALQVIAIELLCACQGLDFRKPLRSSKGLQQVHAALRRQVPFAEHDRLLADDIAAAAQIVRAPVVQALVSDAYPSA